MLSINPNAFTAVYSSQKIPSLSGGFRPRLEQLQADRNAGPRIDLTEQISRVNGVRFEQGVLRIEPVQQAEHVHLAKRNGPDHHGPDKDALQLLASAQRLFSSYPKSALLAQSNQVSGQVMKLLDQ